MIVATAGHVDHGKTSLVRALTGVDTDRLPEEKKRGLTIDLGFAYLDSLGFVDVPGHERFVHNMLAGVAGIDFALLVVAADDGPMPQTREHLAILELLGVPRGAVALTKIDRVAPERADEASAEVAALLAPTRFAGSPVFPVSNESNSGIPQLLAYLKQTANKVGERKAGGNFRLSVDRCFTIAGAGLVVTGTAMSGEVALGDEVRALLADAKARVRSIHAHNAPAARGRAGQRLALNLAGLHADARIARGDWIVAGEVPPAVTRLDVRLNAIESLKHWSPVHVHLGAADVIGRVAILDAKEIAPGKSALAQLVLEKPIGAVRGDRFIVRDQSARSTLGGGAVIDVFPPARGRAKPERLAYLAAMEIGDDARALEALLAQSPTGLDLARFAANRNLPAMSGWRFSETHRRALRDKALANIAAWHARSPDTVGPPEDRILEGVRLPREVVVALAQELAAEGAIVREALGVRLPSHRVELSASDMALWQKAKPALEEAGTRPPPLGDLALQLSIDPKRLEAVLSRAARQGMVVRVSKNRFFLPQMLRQLEDIARAEVASGSPLTAAAFRDRSGIGRNLTIEVLEYFDRIKFTRRVGDVRVIRGQSPNYGDAKLKELGL
ncbi:MAG: selenocysteine-specific translation elongation factor [Betaproteobacteria bacterium]|nr:MAG: selenocysteine-specific translation elongation factor [Betaproteobacteria bacterium]